MSVPQRLFTSFAKFALAFSLVISLGARDAYPSHQDDTLRYIFQLLNHIETHIFFPIDERKVLAKSAEMLERHPADFLTREQYFEVLQRLLRKSPHSEIFFQKVMKSVIVSLPDPYAEFLSPAEVLEEKKQKNGATFTGFGLEVGEKNKQVQIAAVIPGSAADNAGIYRDDVLVAVDGTPVHGLVDANELLRGDLSSGPSTLVFKRGSRVFSLALKRKKIRLVPFSSREINRSGYMALQIITPGIDKKVLNAVERFRASGIRFIFLDLRNCLGGDVPTATRIAGYFLPHGRLVYIQESHQSKTRVFNPVEELTAMPMAVLTSSSTGSAAELITGALHDHDRAKIYGEPTLGKGYIQTTWLLRDGSEIRITTARYLTPDGSSIGQDGIMPDYSYHWEKDLDKQLDAIFTSLQH